MIHQPLETDGVSSNGAATAQTHDLLQFSEIAQFAGFMWRHKWVIMLGTLTGICLGALWCVKRDADLSVVGAVAGHAQRAAAGVGGG